MNPWDHDVALSEHCYYVGEIEAGLRSCNRALSYNLPFKIENLVRTNMSFYTPTISDICNVVYVDINVQPCGQNWSLFNPTIINHNGVAILLVRSSNYYIKDGFYHYVDGSEGIKTSYRLAYLENDMIKDSGNMDLEEYPKNSYHVDGIEDLRLFTYNDKLMASGTILNHEGYNQIARVATVEINVESREIFDLKVLSSVNRNRHEKNWMPILGTQEPSWLYLCYSDRQLLSIKPSDNGHIIYKHGPSPNIAKGFRGGSQVIPWNGGYLCIIHEVGIFDNNQRVYSHRFLRLTNSLGVESWSNPFFLKQRSTIEFAAGIMQYDGHVYVSFGVYDKSSHLLKLSSEDVKHLLVHQMTR